MKPRNRPDDLDSLADAVMAGLTIENEQLVFDEDVRYRLLEWILQEIGAQEDGFEQYHDHYARWFTGEQNEYALGLWDDVVGHIRTRWEASSEARREARL